MREIVSPLSGIISPLGILRSTTAYSVYAIGGYEPGLIADFGEDYFLTGEGAVNFSEVITHSTTTNATMVDSDGLLKWRPHNLLLRSEEFDNASWVNTNTTDTSNAEVSPDGTTTADAITETTATGEHNIYQSVAGGVTQTVGVYVKAGLRQNFIMRQNISSAWRNANFVLSGSGSVGTTTGFDDASITSVGDGWYFCTATSTNRTDSKVLFLTSTGDEVISFSGDDSAPAIYLWGAHLYRSDLGGMVNNPDRGDSYVPTTTSAVYLPRRGHHVYNGSAWVNEGLLHESEARTNLITQSNDFSAWTIFNTDSATITPDQAVGPDGETNLDLLEITDATNEAHGIYITGTTTSGATLTLSSYLRDDDQRYVQLLVVQDGNKWGSAIVDLQTLSITQENNGTQATVVDSGVEDMGGGLCRAYVTAQMDAGSTVAQGFVLFSNSATPSLSSGGGISYSGTAGSGFYAGFAQLEASSTPSSYIPTAGATVTRAAETLTVPAANLPWPSPVVIGEELVTNGTFDDASWWGTDASWTIADGVATVTGNDQLYSPLNWVPSAAPVLISFDVTQVNTAGNLAVIATAPANQAVNITSTGTYTAIAYFNTADRLRFGFGSGSTFRGSIDNISVREINPLSVSIQMQGRMTYADTGVTTEALLYNWSLDGNNYIYPELYTVTDPDRIRFKQAASSVFDFVQDNTYFSPGVNVPFNIASRHGSTFINGAVGGVALTADTTPVALPDLSATDLGLGYDYMGTIKLFRMWSDDLADAGIAEATLPSLEPSLSLTFDGSETSFTVSDWSE
jgi:hypothetical protein